MKAVVNTQYGPKEVAKVAGIGQSCHLYYVNRFKDVGCYSQKDSGLSARGFCSRVYPVHLLLLAEEIAEKGVR